MKEKGFTLVEVLGIITIIALVGLLITPIVNNLVKNNQERAYNEQINRIVDASKRWGLENTDKLSENKIVYLEFDTLITEGFLINKDIKDPRNESELTGCVTIKYLSQYNQYSYEYDKECVKAPGTDLVDLPISFEETITPGNGWYTSDFYVNINIDGASSYEWCGTTQSSCIPDTLVNSDTGSALINTESDSNVICVIAYDSEGNYTNTVCSDIYKLDKTGPTFAGLFDNTVIRGTDFDVRDGVNVKDDLSGLDGNFTVTPESVDTSRIGSTTLTYTATDNAGNTTTATRVITVDSSAPTLVFNSTQQGNSNGWYNSNITLNIDVTDDSGLGINNTKWCETIGDSCTPSNNGTSATITLESSNVKVCAQSTDNSGKTSNVICSETYKLDKTDPYFSGISDETIQKGETFDVRNGVTVNDALSDIDGDYSVSPTSVDTSKAGTTVLTYSALDKAGNTKEITRTIVVDAEGPELEYVVTSSPNSNGWYNSTFFLNINVTDNSGTGIKETKWCGTLSDTCTPTTSGTTAQVSLEGSSTRICAQSTDNNNKTSEVICSDAYKLDTTAPSKPSITGGSNSYVTSASISLSTASTDTTSGGITYEYYLTSSSTTPTTSTTATGTYTSPMTFNTNRAGEYIYVRAKDQAGNIGEWSDVQRLYIDINDPTISAKGNSYTITEGDSNVISSTYFNIDKNGNASISSTSCTSNIDGTVSNTSSLSVNTHTLTCTVTKSTNKTANASTEVIVESVGIDIGGQKVRLVTTGDGLYQDDDGIYRYKGANPNNYITLGTETYRILAIESQGIKVIRSANVKDSKWNSFSSNTWNGSTAQTYLNNTYYSNLSSIQSYIVENATWNVGRVINSSPMLLSTIKSEEKGTTWTGKIGLITVSEYVQAQSPSSSGYSSCSANIYDNINCGTDNWLTLRSWTMSPSYIGDYCGAWIVFSGGYVSDIDVNGNSYGLRPVVVLKPNIQLSGSGTPSQPFTIIG